MSQSQLIHEVTTESFTDVLQTAGYRVNQVEQNGMVQLLSASQGVGYAVRFGSPAAEHAGFLDFTFSCALRVQGELPAGLVGQWNISRRFARLSEQGEFLVLEMDVMVGAGVSGEHLRSNLELWERVLLEFVTYLRDYREPMLLQAASEEEPSL